MKYSKDVEQVLNKSKEISLKFQSTTIDPEHLFLGLIADNSFLSYQILDDLNIKIPTVKKSIEDILIFKQKNFETDGDTQRKTPVKMSNEVSVILTNSEALVADIGESQVDSDIVLFSVINTKNNVINDMFSKVDSFIENIKSRIMGNYGTPETTDTESSIDDSDSYNDEITKEVPKMKTKKKQKLIEEFGDNITKRAKEGKLDPVVGRKIEIKRISQILSRRKKNNPVLIGEPGVGKSAIVEGLAQLIVKGKVPNNIKNKEIYALNMGALVAGTKYRGEFEARLRGIVEEIEENPNIVLFIDEIHTIIGAGSAQGSLDASNMLKPALARGTFQCIGATTIEEYRKHIEKDGALERRFQKIAVDPTTVEETIKILKNLKSRYEEFHTVSYTDDAIEACVNLTDKYMNDRFMPDKAIDAMDEAGAKVHVDSKIPQSLIHLEEKIADCESKKSASVKEQKFEKAASWRDKERNLIEQLEIEKKKWKTEDKNREIVNKEDIAEVVSMMTKIPLDAVDDDETNKLKKLAGKMKNIIIGQDDAVDKIVRSIKRSRIGIKDPKRPVGSFMFLGSTGVGKTYLAKMLAKELFGSEDSLIRIDMSEYMEKHAVSKLIGAPPGYVGYDEGGELTEAVRRKPYSIILFDEMEKAHNDVFNILLQVLDDGTLTDSNKRRVNFKNCLIIMTSNTGSRKLKDFGTGMGFQSLENSRDLQEKKNSVIDKEVKKTFTPEFLNRVDDIVMFNSLSKDNIYKIIDLEMKESLSRLKSIGYTISVTKEIKEFLFKKGWDADYGARPLKRSIQTYIEDVLTDAILDGEIVVGDRISLRVVDDKVFLKKLQNKKRLSLNDNKLLEEKV